MPDRPRSFTFGPSVGRDVVKNAETRNRQSVRQFATNSQVWRLMRLYHLRGEPLCRQCAADGVIVSGRDVDHIDGDSTNNASENLQTLCHACHSRKTRAEQ